MTLDDDVKKVLAELSLEEKISLLSGAGDFHTQSIERVGLPSFYMSDGPHGLRKQEQDNGLESTSSIVKAVCFPAACTTACSFDKRFSANSGKR
jgi:beta-glucosidase